MKKLGHMDTTAHTVPFGKHRGAPISELPSSYLRWLEGQDWFEEKHEGLLEVVQAELSWRDETGQHWEE